MKIKVSVSTSLPTPPDGEHVVYTFKPPKTALGVVDTNGLGIIPHQTVGSKHESDAIQYLKRLKILGYDWKPENLSMLELNGLKMFFSNSSQYPEEVEAQLGKDGYKVKHIPMSLGQWVALEEASKSPEERTPANTPAAPITETDTGFYARTRYLWKHHASKLNEWELKFVKSIGERLAAKKPLSPAQIKSLNTLLNKHEVPMSATASRAYPDDDLSTLRGVVPNANYARFDPSDSMHYAGGWHGNPSGQSKKAKKTISGYTAAEIKRRKRIEKQKKKEALEREKQRNKEHPVDNANVVDKSLSAEFGSQFGVGEDVVANLNGTRLYGNVLGVTFMAGKVLYTLCVYTGSVESSLADQYGILNSVGWDADGREYIRVSNLDSIYIESPGPTINIK